MINDLRFAFRMLVKYPAFSIVAFLALVLGIGANTTVFGIINALLLRPLPVGHSKEVVKVFTTDNHIKGNNRPPTQTSSITRTRTRPSARWLHTHARDWA